MRVLSGTLARRNALIAIVLALSLCACSTVMEFQRPDPIDLAQFHPGERRIDVVKVLGPPLTSMNDGPKSCDIYHLYTHGPNAMGKAGIALVEGAADVLTLGVAEVVSTPVEAGTKNSLYPVTMCYDKNAVLLSVDEASQPIGAPAPAAASQIAPVAAQAAPQ